MHGNDLLELQANRISNGELMMEPEAMPGGIGSNRMYRVVMPLGVSWGLWKAEDKIHDTEAGPDWSPTELWMAIFGK